MKALITLLASCTIAAGAAEYREFTARDGRKLKAEVLSCDGVRGRVKVRRDDGKTIVVKIHAFSPEDQAYIRQWIPVSNFLSTMEFPVTVSKVEERKWRRTHEGSIGMGNAAGGQEGNSGGGGGGPGGGGGGGGGPGGENSSADVVATDRYARYRYDIKLLNRSPSALSELNVEYCIYYEQERAVPEDSEFGPANRSSGPQSGGINQGFYEPLSEIKVQTGKQHIAVLDPHGREV
ncbi:hypothetical protein, partial [Pontiella sp.]|uniref:hypothetical protein n=1 Tax=Pontiella sp. TaxID=2837462 RepID=UPI00356A7436